MLTGRERVNRALERRDQDRVPRYDDYWPETLAAWKRQGYAEDRAAALTRLDADLHECGRCLPAPFPGRHEVVSDDGHTVVAVNVWGEKVRQFKHRSTTPEHLGFECRTRDDWERRFKPALRAAPVQLDLAATGRALAAGRRAERWCYLHTAEPFAILRHLLGDEGYLVAMVEAPDWIRDIAQGVMDVALSSFDAALEAGIEPDGIFMGGDMAYSRGPFCSPVMYRDLVWPEHRRLAEWAHARDMKLLYHTDGDVNDVLDLYVEAGIDALHPLEVKAGMDLSRVVTSHGEHMAFFGNIDCRILASNDPVAIESEMKTKLEAGKEGRGYFYHCDHSIPPQVTPATYTLLIELLDRHGRYA